MLFIILLVLFCYVLHRMCFEKGLSPWKYLLGFVGGFFLVLFATSFAILMVYGQGIIQDPDMAKKIMVFTPFALLFHFLLFIYFRRKINRAPAYDEMHDDEPTSPPPPAPKKDLSYFR